MKRWAAFLLKFAVSAALIVFVTREFDLEGLADSLSGAALLPLASAAGLFVLLLINNTLRWRIVMHAIGAKLGFWMTLRILYIGIFLNQALPSSIGGDAARMYFARRAGLSLSGAVNGVMLERVATVLGLAFLVVATQPFLIAGFGDQRAWFVFPVFLVAAVAAVTLLMVLDRIPEHYRRWAVVRGLAHLAHDTKRLFLGPVKAVAAVALGASGNVLLAAMVFAIALSLGIEVTLIDCIVLFPPVILVMTIPISIAGWGVREVAMGVAFGFVGVSQRDAYLMSILFGLLNIALALPGGVIWLLGGGRAAVAEAERELEAADTAVEAPTERN